MRQPTCLGPLGRCITVGHDVCVRMALVAVVALIQHLRQCINRVQRVQLSMCSNNAVAHRWCLLHCWRRPTHKPVRSMQRTSKVNIMHSAPAACNARAKNIMHSAPAACKTRAK